MRVLKERHSRAAERARQGQSAYLHLLSGKHDARSLAKALGVSVATAARVVESLRADLARKGMRLVSERGSEGFQYVIRDDSLRERIERDPFVRGVIRGHRKVGPRMKQEDVELYGRD